MDIVITYVDLKDPVWLLAYKEHVNSAELLQKTNRYENMGTLKYLLRGIDMYMPFINNVFLVVSTLSQVPDYVDTEKVKIVTHEMFMPKFTLPTFNSCTIEMFLPLIPGLSDEFIYFNDDILPIQTSTETDWFINSMPVCNMDEFRYTESFLDTAFKKTLVRTTEFVYSTFGIHRKGFVIIPEHGAMPYHKVYASRFFYDNYNNILKSLTRTRYETNIVLHVYNENLYLKGFIVNVPSKTLYIDYNNDNMDVISDLLNDTTHKVICLNDMDNVVIDIQKLHSILDDKYSNKSKYEI